MATNRGLARLSAGSVWGPAGKAGHSVMQRALSSPFERDGLSHGLVAAHIAIMGYVLLGWLSHSRIALYLYLLFLPLIALQWIFNSGASVLCNFETYVRTGHWRDRRNSDEGAFLINLLERLTGLRPSPAQMMTVVYSLMFLFWQAALFRMILIPTEPIFAS